MKRLCSINSFSMQDELQDLGLVLQSETGHLHYARSFLPLKLHLQLMLIRHGETYGNCGQTTMSADIDLVAVKAGIKDKSKRVFQGNVDTHINQLTQLGRDQAVHIALILEQDYLARGWKPDIVFHSPLNRAKETGDPFIARNRLEEHYFMHPEIREISFGAWENRRVCDMPLHHPSHSFYSDQNALAVESGINANGIYQRGECFAENILNAYQVLLNLNQDYPNKKIILFTHSMFGAACSILLGKGRAFDGKKFLAFDGKDKYGRDYCLPHAKPIPLNF